VLAKDAVGEYGERVAAQALVEAGMTVLARNWRCEVGEIDIVARDGDVLVVCEVKTRSSDRFGSPFDAITRAKAARLRRLAVRWIEASGTHPPEIRFDVVGVVRSARGAARVEHLRGVL
jgi:putative endonuclease